MHDWPQIVADHGPLVWGVAWRILRDHAEALDCSQDVFLEAVRVSRDQHVRDWPAVLRWLTVRRALDRLRTRQSHQARLDSTADPEQSSSLEASPAEKLSVQEAAEIVRRHIRELPGPQAEVFWLRSIEQLSYAEISVQTGLDSNAIGVLLHRARTRLKEVLMQRHPQTFGSPGNA